MLVKRVPLRMREKKNLKESHYKTKKNVTNRKARVKSNATAPATTAYFADLVGGMICERPAGKTAESRKKTAE